jgi:hypothetical protein
MTPYIKPCPGIRTNKIPYIKMQHIAIYKKQEVLIKETYIDQRMRSISFTDQLIDILLSKVFSVSETAFLFILMSNMTRDTGKAYLNVKKVSVRMNRSESSVRSYIRTFKKLELITKVHGRGSADQYYVDQDFMFKGNRINFLMSIDPNLVECVNVNKQY